MGYIPFGGFADVDRKVANPFEIVIDFNGRDDDPQVNSHGLMQSQQLEAAVVDFEVELVNRFIASYHFGHEVAVPLDQCARGETEALLSQPAHDQ